MLAPLYGDHRAIANGSMVSSSLEIVARAKSASYWLCRFSQKSTDVPKNRASRSAVSAVMERPSLMMAAMRVWGGGANSARPYFLWDVFFPQPIAAHRPAPLDFSSVIPPLA